MMQGEGLFYVIGSVARLKEVINTPHLYKHLSKMLFYLPYRNNCISVMTFQNQWFGYLNRLFGEKKAQLDEIKFVYIYLFFTLYRFE